MKSKKMIGLSIGIVLILISTPAISSMGFFMNNYPTFTLDPYPQLDAYKKVWNVTSGSWEDEITVEKGTIIRW